MSTVVASHDLAQPSAKHTPQQRLLAWSSMAVELAYVYSRSKGGLIITGRGVIAAVDDNSLRLRSIEANLLVTIAGATFSTEPQRFFTANLQSSYLVDGVSLELPNHDWFFLSASARPEELVLLQPRLPTRQEG